MARPVAARRGDEQLAAERHHLLASIRDLDLEHEAGELSDEDYAALRSEYVARAAVAIHADSVPASGAAAADAEGARPAPAHGPAAMVRFRRFLGQRTVRRWMSTGAVVCFVGVVTVVALALAGVRLPGEGVSGGITLTQAQQIRQELEQAQILGSAGQVSDALALYDTVLAADPRQPEALAYRGYLLSITAEATKSSALVAVGRASIEEAIAADPSYGDAHFFEALVLLQDYGEKAMALAQFRQALRDHASEALVKAERSTIVQLFLSMHAPVPAAATRA